VSTLLLVSSILQAQDLELSDQNGDDNIKILAFGDSITDGVGDEEGIGYPNRLEQLIGILVDNEGDPGEELLNGGLERLSKIVQNSNADYVIIMEGANDAIHQISGPSYDRGLQKAINLIQAIGKTPILMTLPPGSEDHAGTVPITNGYSSVIQDLGSINSLTVVDLNLAWLTTCNNLFRCQLYNLPEGLHPNSTGYTVMAQTIAAKLFNIDIFSVDGATQLESAFGLTPGSVIVKPIPVI